MSWLKGQAENANRWCIIQIWSAVNNQQYPCTAYWTKQTFDHASRLCQNNKNSGLGCKSDHSFNFGSWFSILDRNILVSGLSLIISHQSDAKKPHQSLLDKINVGLLASLSCDHTYQTCLVHPSRWMIAVDASLICHSTLSVVAGRHSLLIGAICTIQVRQVKVKRFVWRDGQP